MANKKSRGRLETENNGFTNLKVAGGSLVQFKVKRQAPLSELMKAYCEAQYLSVGQITFRLDGKQSVKQTHLCTLGSGG